MISNKEMGKKLITEAGAVILVSAAMGENATVYAKDVEANAVVGGVPARMLGRR